MLATQSHLREPVFPRGEKNMDLGNHWPPCLTGGSAANPSDRKAGPGQETEVTVSLQLFWWVWCRDTVISQFHRTGGNRTAVSSPLHVLTEPPSSCKKATLYKLPGARLSCLAPSWLSHLFPETSAGCFHFTNEKIEANLFILFICSSLPYAGKHMKWNSASLSKHEMSVLSTKPTCPCLENAFLNAACLHWGSRHLPMVMKGPVERHNKQAFISQNHTPRHKWVSIPWY